MGGGLSTSQMLVLRLGKQLPLNTCRRKRLDSEAGNSMCDGFSEMEPPMVATDTGKSGSSM